VISLSKQKKGNPRITIIISQISLFYLQDDRPDYFFCRGKQSECSSRSSDFWIILLASPSPEDPEWFFAAFIPNYSGGPVSDFHGIPYYALKNAKRISLHFSALEQSIYYMDKKA
jgi:hypothetical protein